MEKAISRAGLEQALLPSIIFPISFGSDAELRSYMDGIIKQYQFDHLLSIERVVSHSFIMHPPPPNQIPLWSCALALMANDTLCNHANGSGSSKGWRLPQHEGHWHHAVHSPHRQALRLRQGAKGDPHRYLRNWRWWQWNRSLSLSLSHTHTTPLAFTCYTLKRWSVTSIQLISFPLSPSSSSSFVQAWASWSNWWRGTYPRETSSLARLLLTTWSLRGELWLIHYACMYMYYYMFVYCININISLQQGYQTGQAMPWQQRYSLCTNRRPACHVLYA